MAFLTSALVGLLVLLLVGSWVYCVLTGVAARRYLDNSRLSPTSVPTITGRKTP
jgi:hypothetical protein